MAEHNNIYDEQLQLEIVADAIKLIESDVIAVINSLTDKEIVELTRAQKNITTSLK